MLDAAALSIVPTRTDDPDEVAQLIERNGAAILKEKSRPPGSLA